MSEIQHEKPKQNTGFWKQQDATPIDNSIDELSHTINIQCNFIRKLNLLSAANFTPSTQCSSNQTSKSICQANFVIKIMPLSSVHHEDWCFVYLHARHASCRHVFAVFRSFSSRLCLHFMASHDLIHLTDTDLTKMSSSNVRFSLTFHAMWSHHWRTGHCWTRFWKKRREWCAICNLNECRPTADSKVFKRWNWLTTNKMTVVCPWIVFFVCVLLTDFAHW